MNFNKLLKFTFSGLMLAATATAYAQGEGATEPTVVTLGNGTQTTWTEFVNALNDPTTIKGTADDTQLKKATDAYNAALDVQKQKDDALKDAQKAYSDAETQLSDWKEELSDLTTQQGNLSAQLTQAMANGKKVALGWLSTANTNATNFYIDYKKGNTESLLKIYYKEETGGGFGGDMTTLTVSFNPSSENDGYTPASPLQFYNTFILDSSKNVTDLNVYFGKTDGVYNYKATDGVLMVTSYQGAKANIVKQALDAIGPLTKDDEYTQYENQEERNSLNTQLNAVQEKITSKTGEINGYTKAKEEGGVSKQVELRNAITNAQAEKDAADGDVETAEKTLADEQSKYDEALSKSQNDALKSYKTVTLTDNVTAATAVADFDGTIIGNGKVITLNGIDALFSNFNGSLANVAINGNVFQAQGNNASYTNVAYWNGTSGAFRDESNNRTSFDKLSKLGYAARASFGVDFANDKLATKTPESVVYNITVFNPRNRNSVLYVQKRTDNNFLKDDNTTYTIPGNRFAKSPDTGLEDYDNMIYDGVCNKAVLTDRNEFYCPEDIEVREVVYERKFTKGMNAVCLPFQLKKELNENIDALCRYDKETTDKFWFKRYAEAMEPNTPVLLIAKDDFVLSFTESVFMDKTPDDQIVEDEGDLKDPSKSYGLFKKANSTEFPAEGSTGYHKIYGLKTNGMFSPAKDNKVNFPAFRMVIYSNNTTESGVNAAPRHIGILDEKGVEITDEYTAVESVYTEASGITVTAGAGEIIITSDADYGKVPVYTMDGKVAAMADVAAGTTTVSVQSGLYIVMGKKVIVK